MGVPTKTIDAYSKIVNNYDVNKNVTSPLMTKYELNQLLSLRVLHISRGAPIFLSSAELEEIGFDSTDVTVMTNMELRKIAVHEFRVGKFPFIIRRTLPNGKTEYWRVSDMDLATVKYILDEHL